jgi:putative transposase
VTEAKAESLELTIRTDILDPRLDGAERKRRVVALAAETGMSPATIYRQVKRLSEGQPARKQRADRGHPRGLDPEVASAAFAIFVGPITKDLNTTLIHKQLLHQFPDRKISYASLGRLRANLKEHLDSYSKAFATIEVERPNQQWQIDCSIADFFAVVPGADRPVRPQLTCCEDACTRSIMYGRYATTTKYMEIAGVLFQSIRKQSDEWPQAGIPEAILMDWGKAFISGHLKAALSTLGIARDLSHPYYPQDKGKVERCIGLIHQQAEPLLPGYCGPDNKSEHALDPAKDFRQIGDGWVDKRDDRPLMTLAEANHYLRNWITGVYHHHQSRTLGCSPFESWLAHQPKTHTYSDAFLEQTFLPRRERQVHHGHLRLFRLSYHHPILLRCHGLKVEVRYDPDDVREVYIYYNGQRYGKAVVDNPLLLGHQLSLDKLAELKSQNAQVAKEKRELLDSLLANPAARADLTDRISQAEREAPAAALFAPDQLPDPTVPGLTHEQIEALRGLTIMGLPVIPGDLAVAL